MTNRFVLYKPTREGIKPGRHKTVKVEVIDQEICFIVRVTDGDEWAMQLNVLPRSRSLACLIAENIPEPVLRRELHSLGFRVYKQVDE